MQRLITALILLVCLYGCGNKPAFTPLPQGAVVLALGDSITHGTGANAGEDYPSRLAALTGWQIVNAGVPGDVAAGGRERLPALLEEHQPQLLIIELGGNDFLRKTPIESIKANLDAILALAGTQGIPVVLLGVPQPSLGGALIGLAPDPLYAELARKHQALLIADALPEVLSDTSLKADPIHPNAKGYARLAQEMHAALVKSGLAR